MAIDTTNMTSGVKPQMFDSQAFQNQYNSGLAGVLGSNQANQNQFLSGYKNAIAGQEQLPDMYKRIGQELNLPTLQSNANQVNNLIANQPYIQRGVTQGFDVNNNQLNNLISKRISDLAPVAQTANTALNTAQNNLTQQMGYGVQQNQQALLPYQTEAQFVGQNSQNAMTGFTTGMQSELNGLLANLSAGVQMSIADQNRLAQLAMAEETNQANLENARRQVVSIGPNGLYNPSTGQTIPGSNQYLSGSQFFNTGTGQWITAPKAASSGTNIGAYLGGGW